MTPRRSLRLAELRRRPAPFISREWDRRCPCCRFIQSGGLLGDVDISHLPTLAPYKHKYPNSTWLRLDETTEVPRSFGTRWPPWWNFSPYLGWMQEIRPRTNQASRASDRYFYSPKMKYQFRSYRQVKRFLDMRRRVRAGCEVRAKAVLWPHIKGPHIP